MLRSIELTDFLSNWDQIQFNKLVIVVISIKCGAPTQQIIQHAPDPLLPEKRDRRVGEGSR